ncbi:DUF2062 domain-containing protein [Acinetobacter sp. WCHAc060033]|uniref:DUF2062 domain-containing protein n=1 Tax=Acinetobacter sp. WCHAc060033 TaxID=2518624 RepID=UPI0010233EE0|nr:DUF2062 domain-containing protein [Acinetobacter sp. WCHAc060033]RZG80107.1 DUF2062 domain-containing protein [Acinetobacter sp. WCHAc060033]
MAKHFFQSWLPSPERVKKLKFMKIFGNKALSPMLWYVNRKSISKAMFIGTFWGILPIPFHTVLIVFTILIFEANLPIGLLLSWIMNPLTIVPILFLAFWIGSKIYHVHMINKDMLIGVFHQIINWIKNFGHGHIDLSLAKILATGLLIEALVFAALLFIITRIYWRWSVVKKWNNRNNSELHHQ